MEQEEITRALEAIGLPEKAATIYAALLGKNRMSIAELARVTSVKRATCYEHLALLLQKDLVSRVPIGKRMYYAAAHPKNILRELKRQTVAIEAQMGDMVEQFERTTNRPKVSFFEGKRELRNIYSEMFKTVGDVYSLFPPDTFFESFSEEDYDEFDKTVSAHAFKSRDLFVKSRHHKRLGEIRRRNGGENKLDKQLPEWFSSNIDVLIFSDKVALMSLKDLSAIVIENKDIADLFRNIHTFMWKSL
ncbi:MAG: helix-turn-helix domain-containing protein [Patescibacteria group bacterium]